MGEEYDKIFSGKSQILVFDDCSGEFEPIGTAVENSVICSSEDMIGADRLSVRERVQFEPLRIKPQSIKSEFSLKEMPAVIGFDEALEQSRCSLVIQSKPRIGRPRNLKYPNKKRARRIWKKWVRRFGVVDGTVLCLPNVEMKRDGDYITFMSKPTNDN